jgi:hypothetical protein
MKQDQMLILRLYGAQRMHIYISLRAKDLRVLVEEKHVFDEH